jgi:hypothetical protein
MSLARVSNVGSILSEHELHELNEFQGTMRPEELSVGNYVYGIEIEGGEETAESLVTRYPIQIESIYGDTILDNYGMERDIKDGIEPIPLTAEILEKNFTKKGNRYGIYDDYYDFELHEYNDGMWQAVYHNCEMSSIPDEQMSICFVHQLQRMMTDCYCGEDFKIDLEED